MADEVERSEKEDKIILFSMENGEVVVWSAEDVLQLRLKYRIIGSLVGSLPRKPKQNVCLSLPLLLSQEETNLLLHKNIARLVKSPERSPRPTKEELERFQELRAQSIEKQIELFDEKNSEQETRNFFNSKNKKKKRKERKRRLKDSGEAVIPKKVLKIDESLVNTESTKQDGNKTEMIPCLKDTSADSLNNGIQGISMPDDDVRSEMGILDAITGEQTEDISNAVTDMKTECIPNTVTSIQKGCVSNANNSITQTECISNGNKTNEQDLREKSCAIHIPTKMPLNKTKSFLPQEWNYPQTNREELKFKIFKDLWESGYYITSGSKFGGDFLVYPGDPFKFHSYFVVTVMSESRKIGMLELISIGRLAATVKKTAVLGSVNQNGEVVYSSIKWSGIS